MCLELSISCCITYSFLSFFFLLLHKQAIVFHYLREARKPIWLWRSFIPDALVRAVIFAGKLRATKLDDLLSLAHGNSICPAGARRRLLVFISMPAMTADDDFDSQTRLPITRGWYPYGS